MKTYQTFEEWNQQGYSIRKGSKATRIRGVAVFSKEQVAKKLKSSYDSWDGADDLNCCGGPMYGIYGNCE